MLKAYSNNGNSWRFVDMDLKSEDGQNAFTLADDEIIFDHEPTDGELDEAFPGRAQSINIPQFVTMRQARLALLQVGKLQAVNDAVAAMTGANGDSARIEWEFSSQVQRDKQLVHSLSPVLGFDDAQLDDLFILAASL